MWDLDKIEAAFANAAVEPNRWNAAMDLVAQETGSLGAILIPNPADALMTMPCSETMLASVETYIRGGWFQRDERFKGTPAMLRRGVATEFDYITPEKIAKSEYHQDFLTPYKLRWYAAVRVTCDDDAWALSMQHTIEQGPYQQAELEQFTKLSARLSSVAALSKTLGFAKADVALDAFQQSGTAAVLLDRRGLVFRANATAEKLVGDGIQIRGGRIVARDAETTKAIQAAIAHLLWSWDRETIAPIIIARDGRRPLILHPISLPSLAQDVLAPARAAVIVIDLEQRVVPANNDLRSVLGLSGAEARLASAIANGEALKPTADQLGIAYETARVQLKSIFQKTDTARQSELVALISRLRSLQSSAD